MYPLPLSTCVRRVSLALVSVTGILMMAACGSGSPVIKPLPGGFTNASLSGQYVITQTGVAVVQPQVGTGVAPFSETIVLTADGNGHLNITVDDFDQVGGPFGLAGPLTGTYGVRGDGTGFLIFNFNPTTNYAITMIDDNHFYIIEQDFFATSSGFGEKQDTSVFAAPPSGNFVFKAHNINSSSRVGGVAIIAGILTGTEDVLNFGTLSSSLPVSTSVAMSSPDGNGRGTFRLQDGTSFNYYIVNSTKFHIMSNLGGSLEIGQAETQTGGPFSPATLPANTSYVFGSSGDTSFPLGIHSAGVFTTDGNGGIVAGSDTVPGAVDFTQDAAINANLPVAGGTYNIDSNGNGEVDLSVNIGTIRQIFWMVDKSRAYFLVDSTAAVEDGTFSLQQGGPFTALSAQAAFVMDGVDSAFKDRVGAFNPTSSGFNWNQVANSFDVNFGGASSALGTTGTYQVSSNGRVTAVVNGVTAQGANPGVVFYLSSQNTGFMVQEDVLGFDIGGSFTQQASR